MIRMTRVVAALLCGTLVSASPAVPVAVPQPTTLGYDLIANGDVNGGATVTLDGTDGVEISNRYQSQDKVRALTVRVRLDANGIPVRMERTGQSFAYQQIDERFDAGGGTARWRNRIEQGVAADASGRYYIPLGLSQAGDSAAYELGMLASAALNAPGAHLSLLPVGAVSAHVVAARTLRSDAGAAAVRLVRIDGLGIEPDYVWLDAVGRLFAGRGAIRAGWRASLPELDDARSKVDADALAAAVRRMGTPATPPPLLFRDVALFDARHATRLAHRDVLLAGGRIIRIGAARSLAAGAGGRVVDGRGKTLLPGLWDMHVHLSGPREALRHLASGVTTIRDMGNHNADLLRLAGRIDRGETPGPTVVKAGFIEGRSPSTTYLGRVVSSEAEAVAAVNSYADEGYAQIKLYNAVHPEWVAAIARATHARGLRLSGHVPFGGSAERAVRDGYDEIQHFVFLFLNFSPEPVYSGLTFRTAQVAQTLDLASPKMTAFIDLLHDRHIATDLTLAVYEPLFLGHAGQPMPVFTRAAARLPAAMVRQVALGPLPTPAGMTTAQFQSTFAKALALARLLHQRGIQIVAGTDFAPLAGLALPRELELLVQAGLTPADVLRIATFDAAHLMHRDDHYGAIEIGKDADVVLVDGDPTRDIAAIRRVRLIVKGGIPYDPASLLAASGIGG